MRKIMRRRRHCESYDIGKDIVKSFHEQFAQNQNHHQALFLQILTILLSVLAAFGYIYIRVDVYNQETKVSIQTLHLLLLLSMYLLSFAVAIISNMGLGFRRDQLLAANIRIKSNVMDLNDDDNFFFKSFNPVTKNHVLTWMPEFHIIMFWFLIIVKAILIGSVYTFPGHQICITTDNIDSKTTVVFMFVLISYVLDVVVGFYYWRKWIRYIENSPQSMKAHNNSQERTE